VKINDIVFHPSSSIKVQTFLNNESHYEFKTRTRHVCFGGRWALESKFQCESKTNSKFDWQRCHRTM